MPFEVVFPEGAYLLGVEPEFEFDQNRRGAKRQAKDLVTGFYVFTAQAVNPVGKGKGAAPKVKLALPEPPELPVPAPGQPFAEVEFEGMTATPYIEGEGDRARIAYSLRATGMRLARREQSNRADRSPAGPGETKHGGDAKNTAA